MEFQEGWAGEPLDLIVNGEVRYHGSPRTRTQIGLAESVSFELDEDGAAEIWLELQNGTRLEVGPTALRGERWLGLSLEDAGKLRVKEQPTPFGYV